MIYIHVENGTCWQQKMENIQTVPFIMFMPIHEELQLI